MRVLQVSVSAEIFDSTNNSSLYTVAAMAATKPTRRGSMVRGWASASRSIKVRTSGVTTSERWW